MGVESSRHRVVLEELIEWREDISEGGTSSRVLLVEVPSGWGVTTVLREFAATVADPDGPVAISLSTDEVLLAGRAADAKALTDALMASLGRSRLARVAGLDTLAGKIGLALGVGDLFVSGLAAQVSLLLAPYGATAVQNLWDASPGGQQGALARAARAVAAVSTEVPVIVLMDDADRFDVALATLMIDNLVSRLDGHVLMVAAVHPGSELAKALRARDRYGLAGRVVTAEADPDMSAVSRTDLIRELRPELPEIAAERIGQRTASFVQVFEIARESRLADITASGRSSAAQIVDAVIDAALPQHTPSAQARILAWAGGALTYEQTDQALDVLGEHGDLAGDPDVVRAGGLARLRDPASAPLHEQVQRLAILDKQALAKVILQEAAGIARDADATLVERTVARFAAHRIRGDLAPSAELREQLAEVQCLLIRGLEQLGDSEAAYQIAATALSELSRDGHTAPLRMKLLKAWLRLARTRPPQTGDPLVREAIDLATTSGALFGTEARVWAAVTLLRRPDPHQAALSLVEQLVTDLGTYPVRDPAASQWRLLLAFHIGQAGYRTAAQHLLAPVISGGTPDQQKAAQAVLRALEGPRADIRLQIIILETELQDTPRTADDDRLRIHHGLAENYHQLGNHQPALLHRTEELRYRLRLQNPNHPDVLNTRNNIAVSTGGCGDFQTALQLSRELLPDLLRVLGPEHPHVLTTRANIALWTGQCGDAQGALQLSRELLPDLVGVLGPEHPHVLAIRANIALWTGQCGDAQGALQLSRELLPDLVRVLGPEHPDVLAIRGNIADWTGQCGDAQGALRLFRELLPDLVRVLGPEYPLVLTNRGFIADWTGQCGDAQGALRLFRELLPDLVRVLGPEHPYVLTTRANITTLTARSDSNEELGRGTRPSAFQENVRVHASPPQSA